MIRQNGFIILDDYEILRKCTWNEGSCAYNWIKWQDEEWLFKKGSKEEGIYEAFWGYVLNYLPIENVEYDIAKQGNVSGIICKNYNPEHKEICRMNDLFKKYWELTGTNAESYKYNYKNVIKLYYEIFKQYPADTIQNLSDKTLKKYIIQILLGDCDLHVNNTDIYINLKPSVAPIYDYGGYGYTKLEYRMDARFQFRYCQDPLTPAGEFELFLKTAKKEEIELMREFIELIRTIKFQRIFEEMEDNFHEKIPYRRKRKLEKLALYNSKKAQKIMRKTA